MALALFKYFDYSTVQYSTIQYSTVQYLFGVFPSNDNNKQKSGRFVYSNTFSTDRYRYQTQGLLTFLVLKQIIGLCLVQWIKNNKGPNAPCQSPAALLFTPLALLQETQVQDNLALSVLLLANSSLLLSPP